VDELYEKIAEKHKRPEDVAFRQRIKRLSPDVVLDLLAETFEVKRDEFCCRHRNSAWRAVASRFLCRYAGLTQREVAAVLEMGTGSAVSHQAQKVDMLMAKDRRLSRLVNSANQRLEELRVKPTEMGSVRTCVQDPPFAHIYGPPPFSNPNQTGEKSA
jgi:hypothetical protein